MPPSKLAPILEPVDADANSAAEPYRLGWRAAALIVVFGGSLLTIGLGSVRVLTYHEVVFAEPAREMLAGGDWAVPKIAGVPFTDKPPATAWMIAAMMWLTGSQSEFIVRLPSVIAAIASAVIIASFAARWFGRRAGMLAGLMHLTAVDMLMLGRLAEADTLLCAGVALAMTIFGLAHVPGPSGRIESRWAPWLFFAALAWCVLAKSMIGLAFVISACGTFILVTRDWRALKFCFNPIGWLIFAAVIVPWLATACQRCPAIWDDMLLHNVGRFQGEMGQREPVFAYAYLVPLMLLPWTPLALIGLRRVWRDGPLADRRWLFLACWCVPGMLILSASAFKSKHYSIPLLPPLTIIAALGLLDFVAFRYRAVKPRLGWFAGGGVIACLTTIVLLQRGHVRNGREIAMLVAILGIGGLVALACEARRRLDWHLTAILGTAWAVAVATQLLVMPFHDSYRHQTEMAERVNHLMPPGRTLYMLHLPDNQITYYLNSPIVRLDKEEKFHAELAAAPAGEYYIIAPQFVADALAAHGEARVLDRATKINRYLREDERVTFLAWKPTQTATGPAVDGPKRRNWH